MGVAIFIELRKEKIMNQYKRPMVCLKEELNEGIYLASGDSEGEGDDTEEPTYTEKNCVRTGKPVSQSKGYLFCMGCIHARYIDGSLLHVSCARQKRRI